MTDSTLTAFEINLIVIGFLINIFVFARSAYYFVLAKSSKEEFLSKIRENPELKYRNEHLLFRDVAKHFKSELIWFVFYIVGAIIVAIT